MSNCFSKLFTLKRVVDAKTLSGSSMAMDVMPYLYQFLYSGAFSKTGILKNSKGEITSYIEGFLKIVSWFKKNNIKLVVCMDGEHHTLLKSDTIKKRIDQRTKSRAPLDLLVAAGLELSEQQKQSYEKSLLYIGLKEKRKIVDLCGLLGLEYYFEDFIQGQKACIQLQKEKVVDYSITKDYDAFMYGGSFFSTIDFKNNTLIYHDYHENIASVCPLLTITDLRLCALCSGCDYTPGIARIGPKIALKRLLTDKQGLAQEAFLKIHHYQKIIEYIERPLCMNFLFKKKVNPLGLTQFLKNQNFRDSSIARILTEVL